MPEEVYYEDVFTTIGVSAIRLAPAKSFSMQVKGIGAIPQAWTVVLEGSLDGLFFTTLMQHTKTDGDGKIVDLVPPTLVRFTRIRVASLNLGAASNIKVVIFGIML